MQIKDIRISEKNKPSYYWPLDETSGNEYRDKIKHKEAGIKNPVWVKNQHQKWETLGSFTINGYAGVAFDPGKDQLYITGSDSLAIYTLKNDKNLEFMPSFHQNLRLGHQNIYDTLNEKLLDEYPDDKKAVAMDFLNLRWDYIFPSHARITEYWHSNKFISPRDTSLYIIGGYGYLRYKNLVQRYNFRRRDGICSRLPETILLPGTSPQWAWTPKAKTHIYWEGMAARQAIKCLTLNIFMICSGMI